MTKLVNMFRLEGYPREAEVHPDQVEDMAAHGWREGNAPKGEKMPQADVPVDEMSMGELRSEASRLDVKFTPKATKEDLQSLVKAARND
ncbi:hypothetical protein ACSMXM_05500 [Pacificimonas sp. ICDLI1SI03]